MEIHPAIESLVHRFENKELHAAHSGRELMRAFVLVAAESQAQTSSDLTEELLSSVDYLLPRMPAYAPPINVIHRFLAHLDEAVSLRQSVIEIKESIANLGDAYLQWSVSARKQIVEFAYELIPQNADIFTFTLSETVMTTLHRVWEAGRRFRIHVTESRPNNDGVDTAKRLAEIGVPVRLSIDSAIPDLLAGCQIMLSGAEAILFDGSAICKIGTYMAALTAQQVAVPLYVLADTMKFDVSSKWGIDHPLDKLQHSDFQNLNSHSEIRVVGHLFDRTPGDLIRAVVSELGVLSPAACIDVMHGMDFSGDLLARLRAR